jgi:hypothetical protein
MLIILTVAAAVAATPGDAPLSAGQPTAAEVWKELRSRPLMAEEVKYRWRGQYTALREYQMDEDTGQPVSVAIQGEPPVSTFELEETLSGGEHHILVRPLEVDEKHRVYSFGKGMEYWNVGDGKDVVVFHDQEVAQVSGSFQPMSLAPADIPLPHRLLSELLSPDPGDWATSLVNLAGSTSPEAMKHVRRPSETLRLDDEDVSGTRETVALPDLLAGDQPFTVAREFFYSRKRSGLPVLVQTLHGGKLSTRWLLEWVPARPGDPAAPGGIVRGHRLAAIVAESIFNGETAIRVRYDLLAADALPPATVAAGLTPAIPSGYRQIDVDAAFNADGTPTAETLAASSPSSGMSWPLWTGLAVAATGLVVVLLIVIRRRRAA